MKIKELDKSDFYIGDFTMKQTFSGGGKVKFEYGIVMDEEVIYQHDKDRPVIWKKVKFKK
jgi:hypothetical protein